MKTKRFKVLFDGRKKNAIGQFSHNNLQRVTLEVGDEWTSRDLTVAVRRVLQSRGYRDIKSVRVHVEHPDTKYPLPPGRMPA